MLPRIAAPPMARAPNDVRGGGVSFLFIHIIIYSPIFHTHHPIHAPLIESSTSLPKTLLFRITWSKLFSHILILGTFQLSTVPLFKSLYRTLTGHTSKRYFQMAW